MGHPPRRPRQRRARRCELPVAASIAENCVSGPGPINEFAPFLSVGFPPIRLILCRSRDPPRSADHDCSRIFLASCGERGEMTHVAIPMPGPAPAGYAGFDALDVQGRS